MQNHLDITTEARDACVSGAVSGRSALTDGASCYSETNVTCATKYEQKSRGTHRVGQDDDGSNHSASYDLVGELHLCEWRPELYRCEAGKVLTVCPEDHVVEVAPGSVVTWTHLGTSYCRGPEGDAVFLSFDDTLSCTDGAACDVSADDCRVTCLGSVTCLGYHTQPDGRCYIYTELPTQIKSTQTTGNCYAKGGANPAAPTTDCDTRWSNGSPAWSRCTQNEPYVSDCRWEPTDAFPAGQCVPNSGA